MKTCQNCMNLHTGTCRICLPRHDGVPSRWAAGENYVPGTLEERACEEVQAVMKKYQATKAATLDMLGIDRNAYHRWEVGLNSPNGHSLEAMALHGLDVFYILTGKRGTQYAEL